MRPKLAERRPENRFRPYEKVSLTIFQTGGRGAAKLCVGACPDPRSLSSESGGRTAHLRAFQGVICGRLLWALLMAVGVAQRWE